ncbi:pirin-like protein [Tanacetum coccineum]
MRVKSLVFTTTPSVFLDFTISLGSQMQQSIPEAWNLFVYVLEGEGKVVDESLNVIRNRMMSDVGRLSGVEKELQFEKIWRE